MVSATVHVITLIVIITTFDNFRQILFLLTIFCKDTLYNIVL